MNTGTDTIEGQVLDLMLRAGSSWVLYLLMALSLGAVAVMIERIWFFAQERAPRHAIAAAMAALRKDGPSAAQKHLAGTRSMEAAVARACIDHLGEGAAAV